MLNFIQGSKQFEDLNNLNNLIKHLNMFEDV